MCRHSATVCLVESPSRQHRAIGGLPSRLAALLDPRDLREVALRTELGHSSVRPE